MQKAGFLMASYEKSLDSKSANKSAPSLSDVATVWTLTEEARDPLRQSRSMKAAKQCTRRPSEDEPHTEGTSKAKPHMAIIEGRQNVLLDVVATTSAIDDRGASWQPAQPFGIDDTLRV